MIYIQSFMTPLGEMIGGATRHGICLFEFNDGDRSSRSLSRIQSRTKSEIIEEAHPLLTDLSKQVKSYFAGERRTFDLPLSMMGTPFQIKVWNRLLDIPYGHTLSYADLALAMGNENAIRAIGQANGANHLAILVPCHRVIGSDGSLTGYGGGIERKHYLLNLEGSDRNTLFPDQQFHIE
jgi:O-6-methylguanine DNA methyltransferase